jgi:hypothetical protein
LALYYLGCGEVNKGKGDLKRGCIAAARGFSGLATSLPIEYNGKSESPE